MNEAVQGLVQYGAIGILLAYFLIQDHFRNKKREAREDELQKERLRIHEEMVKRETECHKHQIEVLEPLVKHSNLVLESILAYLRKYKIHNTPRPAQDDETAILHRDKH